MWTFDLPTSKEREAAFQGKTEEDWQNPDIEYLGTTLVISNVAFRRYLFQAKWLSDHKEKYDKVIMSDIRDIALFGDPFEQIYLNKTRVFSRLLRLNHTDRIPYITNRGCASGMASSFQRVSWTR